MNTIETRDGAQIFYRDWGNGRPILFDAAWTLNSQAWQYQMVRLVDAGFRCIAFDRRGHGRSSDPGTGYDIDALADDVAHVVEQLELDDIVFIGHSLGAAEIVRYLTRHGQARARRLVLIAPTTPFLPKTVDNPDGVDAVAAEAVRTAIRNDFAGAFAANIKPFVVPSTSQALMDWVLQMASQNSLHAVIECNRAFTTADFRAELPKIVLPTLIVQGDADVSTPLPLTGRKTVALMPNAQLKVYEGGPHGLIYTHTEKLHADLMTFIGAS